jgi:hypothetical protein
MLKAIFAIMLALVASASAYSWAGYVNTSSDSWHIYRQSENLSFNFTQSVEGSVSPVEGPGGRVLSPYYTYYADLRVNDVRLRERTAALQGKYRTAEQIKMISRMDKAVERDITKPAGTDILTVTWSEEWPVALVMSKGMDYYGKGINERTFAGNNLDFAGTSFLYSTKFSKKMGLSMGLERLNITVLATDEGIQAADVKATRHTDYNIKAYSNGIADVSYRQADYSSMAEPAYLKPLNEGRERYYGEFEMTKRIRMRSVFRDVKEEEGWLPCCYGGWSDMRYYDQKGFGKSANGIFDCSCYRLPS